MIRVRYTQKNVTQWIKNLSEVAHFFPKVSFIVQLRKRLKWSAHEMVSRLVFSLKESWIHKICLALIKINGYFDLFFCLFGFSHKNQNYQQSWWKKLHMTYMHLCSCKSFAKIVPIPKNYILETIRCEDQNLQKILVKWMWCKNSSSTSKKF